MADLDAYIFVPTQQSKRFLALTNVRRTAGHPIKLGRAKSVPPVEQIFHFSGISSTGLD